MFAPEEAAITVVDFLKRLKILRLPKHHYPVEATIAREVKHILASQPEIQLTPLGDIRSEKGSLNILVVTEEQKPAALPSEWPQGGEREALLFQIDEQGCGWLLASQPAFLYLAWTQVAETLLDKDAAGLSWLRHPAFKREKATFDLFLTQYARLIRDFDREPYIREHARLGFTHLEVNALAGPFPAEEGVEGEFYPDFYTYCPALDQFVSSRLNQGIYPEDYLDANLAELRQNALLALKYGLTPGLLCFEPRSVPEAFFQKYPTLRGARVDHPFRSFKPRYNLSIAHPVVKQHYTELIQNLLREVPALEFLSIWTNDSGAGFEHTQSLYVGRNGGAYLIREWKDSREIARTAAANVVSFLRLLRDAAREINPRFRVTTRLEPFYGELEFLWPELGRGVDVEGNSLTAKGWEPIYPHPRYPEIKVSGSALQNTLDADDKLKSQELAEREGRSYFYHMFGTHTNHEPLLGIPFPWLTFEKLQAAHALGLENLAHLGGIHPPGKVPYAVNQEVFRRFQMDPGVDIDQVVGKLAEDYTGSDLSEELAAGWRLVDQAVRSVPPLSIYSHYGVVWQRLLARPLVPDIGRIPQEARAYYEDFMCTSIHNPNRVDLARDVLFELITPEYARSALVRIESSVLPPLDQAVSRFQEAAARAAAEDNQQASAVFRDQSDRLQALRCLFETLRNTACWIHAVHTTLQSEDAEQKTRMQELLCDMSAREIRNCRDLIKLWETSSVEWMIVSGKEETPFIYAENLGELLDRKISLMLEYGDAEPRIDPDYMFQVEGNPYAGQD